MKSALAIVILSTLTWAVDVSLFTTSAHVNTVQQDQELSGNTAIVNTYTHDTYGSVPRYKHFVVLQAVIDGKVYELKGRRMIKTGDYKARLIDKKDKTLVELLLPDNKTAEYTVTAERDDRDPLGIR